MPRRLSFAFAVVVVMALLVWLWLQSNAAEGLPSPELAAAISA